MESPDGYGSSDGLYGSQVPPWFRENEGRCPKCGFEAGSDYEAAMHEPCTAEGRVAWATELP